MRRLAAGGLILQGVCALTACLALAGCDERWSRLDPPRLVQLACKPGQGEGVMVLVIDTGRRQAIWANGPGGPEGAAEISKSSYRLTFGKTATTPAWSAIVGRFDGVMDREQGRAPFSLGAAPKTRGNQRQAWRCEAQKPGPKL